jgi:hypothetical protein
MGKRKASDVESFEINNFENNLKRLSKKSKIDDNWISGTTISNYLNGEPLLDWLKLYYNKYGFNEGRITRSISSTKNKETDINEQNPLLSNGLLFESKVYEDLQKKFKNAYIKIDTNKTNGQIDFHKGFIDTLKQLELKTPIIAQAVLLDEQTQLRGITDLLVRYDFVNKIFKRKVVDLTEQNKRKYLVIDIKWTSMTLCVDGKTIRNEGRFKAYKGQLFIYNYILGKIQNYMSPISLILAKNWKIASTYNQLDGYNCYDLAGVINYEDKDKSFIGSTLDAINWIYKVRNEGITYSPLNPTIKEMCVNASNHNDNGWESVKKEILKKTKDITQVWNLTQKHRDYGFDNNIKSWEDVECTTDNLNMNKTKTSIVIDKILNINRQNQFKILPNKKKDIKDNRFNWKRKFPTDFFIDFETTSEHIKHLTEINLNDSRLNSQIIFMIGVGYEYEEKFHYKCFNINQLTLNEEKRILTEFKEFIDTLKEDLDKKEKYNTRLFHWSNAEPVILESAFNRHPSIQKMWEEHIEWVDLCDLFIREPIVVKGALSFKLKEIANALFSHGLINTNWSDSNITDGLNAMVSAMRYYNAEEKDENIIENITKYNKVDCKVLWEILNLLRSLD